MTPAIAVLIVCGYCLALVIVAGAAAVFSAIVRAFWTSDEARDAWQRNHRNRAGDSWR